METIKKLKTGGSNKLISTSFLVATGLKFDREPASAILTESLKKILRSKWGQLLILCWYRFSVQKLFLFHVHGLPFWNSAAGNQDIIGRHQQFLKHFNFLWHLCIRTCDVHLQNIDRHSMSICEHVFALPQSSIFSFSFTWYVISKRLQVVFVWNWIPYELLLNPCQDKTTVQTLFLNTACWGPTNFIARGGAEAGSAVPVSDKLVRVQPCGLCYDIDKWLAALTAMLCHEWEFHMPLGECRSKAGFRSPKAVFRPPKAFVVARGIGRECVARGLQAIGLPRVARGMPCWGPCGAVLLRNNWTGAVSGRIHRLLPTWKC